MSIRLNQEIWVYVERLYIHCYGSEDFKIFLKKYGIEYESECYSQLDKPGKTNELPIYKFMSEPNYDFANFMQTTPTYKYLPILQQVVFDPKIIATRKNGWNYYGESIRGWHPKIFEILRATGINIDPSNKKLSANEDEENFGSPDFLPYDFNDLFLDYIRKEINGTPDFWIVMTEGKYTSNIFHRKNTGVNHFAFHVSSLAEVDKFSEKFLKPRSIKTLYGSPKKFPEYTPDYYAVFFEDPDRIKLEICFIAPDRSASLFAK